LNLANTVGVIHYGFDKHCILFSRWPKINKDNNNKKDENAVLYFLFINQNNGHPFHFEANIKDNKNKKEYWKRNIYQFDNDEKNENNKNIFVSNAIITKKKTCRFIEQLIDELDVETNTYQNLDIIGDH